MTFEGSNQRGAKQVVHWDDFINKEYLHNDQIKKSNVQQSILEPRRLWIILRSCCNQSAKFKLMPFKWGSDQIFDHQQWLSCSGLGNFICTSSNDRHVLCSYLPICYVAFFSIWIITRFQTAGILLTTDRCLPVVPRSMDWIWTTFMPIPPKTA